MDTYLLYDRVCLREAHSHEQFLSHLNYTLAELCSMYGEEKVMEGPLCTVERVGEAVAIRDEYALAVLDNILYLCSGDDRHKTDFTAHARYAYNTLWREKNMGRRIRREVW